MTTKRLRVEGGTGSSGLFAYRSADGSFSISVLVYPKTWQLQTLGIEEGERVFRAAHDKGFTILLQEGEELSFPVDPLSEPAIEHMIGELQDRRKAWRKTQSAWTMGDADTSDVELDLDSGTSLPIECALTFSLRRTSKPTAEPQEQVVPEESEKAADALTAAIRHLAWLCLRAGALRSTPSDGSGEEFAGQLLDASRATDIADPLALLAEVAFVQELHRLQDRIRKGYVPEQEPLTAIRGRITDRGVLDYEMTRVPLIECRFDEFIEATALFRVLVTALDIVASATLRHALGIRTDRLFGGEDEIHPATMREQLRSIPSLPVPLARATAERLRLTRLQQEWQRPLDLARRILRAESVETGHAAQNGAMTVWSVNTPKIWERILEQAFEAGGAKVTPQKPITPPWVNLGSNRNPDLIVQSEQSGTYIVDAKYKLGTAGSTPADQYQIFAYSLILSPPPCAVALVYPRQNDSTQNKKTATTGPHPRTPTNVEPKISPCPLYLIWVDFPTPELCRDGGKWHLYLETIGKFSIQQLEGQKRQQLNSPAEESRGETD